MPTKASELARVIDDIEIEPRPSGSGVLRAKTKDLRGLDVGELMDALEYWRGLARQARKVKGGPRQRMVLSRVRKDIFHNIDIIVYPLLLSKSHEMELAARELISEIELVLQMADPTDLSSGTYVYSVQVLEPLSIATELDTLDITTLVPDLFIPETRHGYLYHKWLYETYRSSPGAVVAVLSRILSRATRVEVTLRRGPASEIERKMVRISPKSQQEVA